MDEAEFLCDRVAIMDEGRIVAIDSPAKMIDDLLERGFQRHREVKGANLEDVFIAMTGHGLRED
jgi:ABC-2 type transport system ATP-binding protein